MPAILKNNASSTLATAITATETSVVVADGSQFPAVTGEEYFYATLVSQTGIVEIVKVTTRVGNTMVVARAEDGSTASSFQAGALVEMRVNAASVVGFSDIVSTREYDVTGDGVTDDGNNFEEFVVGAETATFGTIPPAVYRIGNNLIDDPSNSRIIAAPGAVLERTDTAQNMFTYRRPVNVDIDGLTFDGRFDTLGTPGHGLVLIDPIDVTVDRLTTTNLGGIPLSTGGTGLLAYKSLNPGLDKIRITRSNFDGAVGSTRSLGLVMVDSEFSTVTESHSSNMGEWGLEFKNNANFNVMANSTGYFNRYGFGIGSDALPAGHNNVFSALTSKDCDSGLTIGQGINNVIAGLSAHADAQPDTFANNQAYGLHLEASAHENLAIGVLTSGTIMDYPVRIRGSRNVVSIADYSDAVKTVTFNAGAQENYVEILHIGEKAESIAGLVADLNSPIITRGAGANVVDSPLTREYYGSIRNNFKWSLAGYTTTYAHFSSASFVYEGFGGSSILGLGVGDTGEAGLSVSTTTTGGVGSIVYVNGASPYWRYNVGGVQTFRLDGTKLAPVTAGGLSLGNSTLPFNQIWGNFINTASLQTDAIRLDVADGGETAISVSTPTVNGVGTLSYVNTAGSPYWRFNVDSAQKLRIDATKVAPVTANGMSLGSSTVPFASVYSNYVNTNTIDVNGTIDTTGFVEVGILGTGDRSSAVDFHSSGLPNTINYSARILRNAGENGALSTYNNGTGNIVWWINNVAKMTIEGTTGKVYLTSSGSRSSSGWVICSGNDSVANGNRQAGYIEWTTDIGAVGTNYFVSDVRLKDNVAPSVQSSADLINQIDFIQFDWKPESGNEGHVDVGVSAQQLQGIDARLVNELSDGGLMVNEPALVTHMAKALQEALTKITALEARITALET